MSSPRRRFSLPTLAFWSLALFTGCSGGLTGGLPGCDALKPLPARFSGPKADNAVNVRLSPSGLNFVNSNWRTLLEAFLPGQKLDFPFPCQVTDAPVLGSVAIADQGNASGAGRMDGRCDAEDLPKNISVTVTGFGMVPRAPDALQVTLSLRIQTGRVLLASVGNSCFLQQLKCSFDLDSERNTESRVNSFRATAKFTIDTRWDRLMAFEVTSLDGAKVCGSGGALPAPMCLEADDIDINGENACGNVMCTVADIGIFKGFVLGLLSPTLESKVKEAIAAQSCEPCGPNLPACPSLGTNLRGTCDTLRGVCMDSGLPNKCVPRFLGLEGRVAPAALAPDMGVPETAQLDFSVAGGSAVNVDTGLTFGTRGGLTASALSDCVPPAAAPPLLSVPAPNFDREATPGVPYHLGIGISQSFANLAVFHAHQAGALCLTLSSDTTPLLNSGLFFFLPSLKKLVTRDGKDAPMRLVLKPRSPPTLSVGAGSFDPVSKKPMDPLLTVSMKDVAIDLYVMLDERFVRLFSVTTDIAAPFSLIFEGCDRVTLALGDVKKLATNLKVVDSEILAEDTRLLEDAIPTLISAFEPALASALKPFVLPAFAGFKLKVGESKGLSKTANGYDHIGLYAQLVLPTAQCSASVPKALVSLRSAVMRAEEQRWPSAVLDVSTVEGRETAEYSYRIDGGLWTVFAKPNVLNQLEITHPRLALQGVHEIEVRARLADDPHGVSAPVKVAMRVDLDAPSVSIVPAGETRTLRVIARDSVTTEGLLQYAYKLGEAPRSEFGGVRSLSLDEVEEAGIVEVQVRDESGNVGSASYRPAPVSSAAATTEETPGGCAVAGGEAFLFAALLGLGSLWRRRAPRR